MSEVKFRDLIQGISEQLDARTFLEPRSLLVLAGPILLLTTISTSDSATFKEQVGSISGAVLVLAILAAVTILIRFMWLRKFSGAGLKPIWLTVIGFFLGVTKVLLTIFILGNGFSELVEPGAPVRFVQGGFAGAWVVLFAAVAPALLEQFDQERLALVLSRKPSLEQLLSTPERKNFSQLSQELAKIIATLKIDSRADLPMLGTTLLRDLVDRLVRPLSSSLYKFDRAVSQGFSISELYQAAIKRGPSALLLAALNLLTISYNVNLLGATEGLLLSLSGVLVIWITLTIFIWVSARLEMQGSLSFFALSIWPQLVQFILLYLVSGQLLLNVTLWLTLALWFWQTAAIFAMAKVAISTAIENRVLLVDTVGNSGLLALRRREKAHQMHGEVQSRLMSLALQGEAGTTFSRESLISELESIRDLVSAVTPSREGFESAIAKIRRTWEPFAKLDIEADLLGLSPQMEQLLPALIQEGVSNAFKHGLASEVGIKVDSKRLVIDDNGIGPTAGKPGLGSSLMTAMSSSWSLGPREKGGSRLEVIFGVPTDL